MTETIQSDLLERLAARAVPVVQEAKRGQNYNFPLAWYRRVDGDLVQLQSDPQNRAYYEDKGYVLLRPAEVREWENVVRPQVIAEQKKRAQLINAIRRVEARNPAWVGIDPETQEEFPSMTLEELAAVHREACEATGMTLRLPPIKPEKGEQPDANLRGVETNVTIEEIQNKLQRTPEGQVLGHGFDPLHEARRRDRGK